ncbi:MAG: hypothetical protein HY830_25180 [Actinobacteria bacterium]|nr:hypothetical protein [Actinomycetota bacterium]
MTRKRTFSLPDDLSDELDRAAGGNASAYVADAVRERHARAAAVGRIDELFGPPDPEAMDWAMELLTGKRPATPAT